MRVSTSLWKCSVAFVSVLAVSTPAVAASISVIPDPGSPSGSDPYTWTYNATLPTGFQLQPSPAPCASVVPAGASCDSLITIYDFAGYIPGSEFAPSADWTFAGALLGPTPVGVTPGSNVMGVDDPLLFNLAWVYTGAAGGGVVNATADDIFIGSFGANTVYSGSKPSEYATQSNTLSVTDGRAFSAGTGMVPAIPEPASLLLMGTGLLALGLMARRWRPR